MLTSNVDTTDGLTNGQVFNFEKDNKKKELFCYVRNRVPAK